VAFGIAGLLLLGAGCGSASPSASVSPSVSPPVSRSVSPSPVACVYASPRPSSSVVTLRVGHYLCVRGVIPDGTQIFDPAPGVLAPVDARTGVFRAASVGTAVLVVTRHPVCRPGHECSQLIVFLGRIDVHVTA
jgi:hypothetical protein